MLGEGQRKDHFEAGFDLNYAWGWLSSLRKVYTGETVTMEMPARGPQNGNRPNGNRPQAPRTRTVNRAVPVSTLFATDSSEYAGLAPGKVKLRFTTNHDEHEKMSPVREFQGQQGSRAAFVASTYIHGGMLIYGCQEVGYEGKIHFFNYCEIDWNANQELFNQYKKVVSVFKEHAAIRKGEMVPYPDRDFLTFERKDASENILVVINMRDVQGNATIPAAWVGKTCTDLITGKSYTLTEKELMRPFEYIVLK
ncbi:MAG: alpha-glucosidase C-terminal domain-containing protein [Bacteroidales bacterium]|nr:alpha-glucosidase C-terminal domain-containing protein [Bacteroidales bacterium]